MKKLKLSHVFGSMTFEVSVDILCNDLHKGSKHFNIFHMTTGGNEEEFGNRFFGIWQEPKYPGNLHITTNHDSNRSYQVYTNRQCTKGEWNTYTLRQTPDKINSNAISVFIEKDGEMILESQLPVFMAAKLVNKPIYVYLADPWYPPGYGYKVRNIIYCNL